jgi:hypothetical protein
MIEAFGDIWKMGGDAVVITTNGAVRRDGACVMGRGIAKQAKERYPGLEREIGYNIRLWGNHVARFDPATGDIAYGVPVRETLYTFPVKHHWKEAADLKLIKRSATELAEMVDETAQVLVPRPGCGNGQRSWWEVKPILEPLLDDRFVIVTYSENDR